MKRLLSRWVWRLRMARFPRAPRNPRSADGRYISRKQWRLEQMREGLGG